MKQVFMRMKKSARVDRQEWTQRESVRLHGSLNYFYGAFPLGFLWPVLLTCLVHSPYLVYLSILPCVHTRLLAKMYSTKEPYGYSLS